MSLLITSLNSGSNGNCYYIGNGSEAVLIDAGISCREIEKRMGRLGLSMTTVKAIFVSHEHADHISGIPALVKKYRLPVYITQGTLKNIPVPVNGEMARVIKAPGTTIIGGLEVIAFNKFHDAMEPVSFVVSEKGSYPIHLKKRIRGKKGHLSNDQALELFLHHRGKHLSHLILSHLSQNNNTIEKVRQLFTGHPGNTEIIVASRYKETPVYNVQSAVVSKRIIINPPAPDNMKQLSLF
jgi:phosphoribosyl 1,2-cyclic phosphodiesterase